VTGPQPTSTLPAFSGGAVPDLVVTGIEVTQGIQNLANQMPLVEGRWTAVRVYVKTQDSPAGVANVKGGIGAWRDGQPLGIVFAENQPILARPDGGQRTNIDDSLLFWLPSDWRSGAVHLKAMAYSGLPSAVDKEPDAANNFIDIDVEFHVADPALIRLVPVHLHQDGDATKPDVTWRYQDHVGDTLEVLLDAFRLLPIHEMYFDPSLEFPITFLGEDLEASGPVVPVGHSQRTEWKLDDFGQAQLPNAGITALKLLSPDYYQGWQWYGTVDPGVPMKLYSDAVTSINITGISNGTTAYGRIEKTNLDQPLWWVRGGMTLVHEMAHNLMPGPDHILCKGSEESGGGLDTNYPYPYDDDPPKTCSMAGIDPAGYYGFDVYWSLWSYLTGPTVVSNDPAAPAPNAGFPLMGYKRPHWADPYDYCKLLAGLGVPCDETAINISATPRLDEAQAALGGLGAPAQLSTSSGRVAGLTSRPVERVSSRSMGGGNSVRAERTTPSRLGGNSSGGTDGARPGRSERAESSGASAGHYLLVSILADETTGTARIVQTLPLQDPPRAALDEAAERLRAITLGSLTSPFQMTFEGADGSVIASYRLVDLDPPNHDGAASSHLFNELVPLPAGTSAIRVRSGAAVLAEQAVSANAPSVRLLTPNNGGSLSGPVDVTWEATDPDGDLLTYSVLYSADAGVNWNPIATGVQSNRLRLQSTAGLAASTQGKFRVIASDGANTAIDDSDGVFGVGNNPPIAYIMSPGDGATFARGASVDFLGGPFDIEDGRGFDVSRLRWTSSLDGDLGTGAEVVTRSLSAGHHRITLTAEDSEGAGATHAVDITIVDSGRPQLPVAGERDDLARRLGLQRPGEGGGSSVPYPAAAGAVSLLALIAVLLAVRQRAARR
jgi:hypothetical protein